MKRNSKIVFRPICLLLLLMLGANAGHAQTAQQIAKKAFGYTVLLVMEDVNGQPLSLGNSDATQVGESVYAVGNPQGLEGTFSQGIISSIREVGTDKLLQITAAISPGSSGGPVLNTKGEVIGVSVATFRGGQNLNFAIPSNYLKILLEKAGPPKPLAQAKPTKSKRSILSDLGGRSSESVIGSHFS